MPREWQRLATVHWLIQTIADVPPHDDWLAPAERERLASLRSLKRRRDWRLGRWTVKHAIAQLTMGSECTADCLPGVVVASCPNGAPRVTVAGRAVPWPVSISHSYDRGLCAIGPAGTSVGCDLERVEPRIDDFTREWFTSAERAAIARAGAGARDWTVTLFWSAKESALKAMGTGLTVSTHDVTVTVDEPAIRDREWSPLYVNRAGAAEPMRGWWRKDTGDLITIVTAPPLAQPVALSTARRWA